MSMIRHGSIEKVSSQILNFLLGYEPLYKEVSDDVSIYLNLLINASWVVARRVYDWQGNLHRVV